MIEIFKNLLIIQIYLPIIYIIIGNFLYLIIIKLVNSAINHRQYQLNPQDYNYKKMETFKVLFKNIIRIVIIAIVLLACLSVFGIDISSVLAGLGIVSAVLALSFQDILKDFIGGLTIILENQFALGDTIEINNFKGEVVQIGLKSTRIRNYEGQTKILANRNIVEVINYNGDYSLAIIDIPVSHEEDLLKVEEILTKICKELSKKIKKLKEPIEILGINSLDNSSVVYRLTAKTVSMEHKAIERQIIKEIKLKFADENIKIPYNQIEVHNGK